MISVTINQLKIGDIFYHKGFDNKYIVTDITEYRCECLQTGRMCYISEDDIILYKKSDVKSNKPMWF